MRKIVIALIIVLGLLPGVLLAEIGADFCFSRFDEIGRSSIGINGMAFPMSLTKGKLSLGFDFGIELIERHLDHITPSVIDTVTWDPAIYTDTLDYVAWFDKEYLDYMFIPFSILLRYNFRDPEKLSSIRPAIFLGIGGVLNIVQESGRQIQDWFYSGSPTSSLPDIRRAVDYGGQSIATFDFFIKPKIALYYQRFYASYEYHFNTRYMKSSFSVGYIFRL
ncbi:MAG: hypothetical protein HQ591_12255 [candidate division Zixibacteria bacterium]|nr:hypothetical protein [Candidatus Tariuqbacter arcticus]